jgi:hypothetical protein
MRRTFLHPDFCSTDELHVEANILGHRINKGVTTCPLKLCNLGVPSKSEEPIWILPGIMARAKVVIVFSSVWAGISSGFGRGDGVLLMKLPDKSWYVTQCT